MHKEYVIVLPDLELVAPGVFGRDNIAAIIGDAGSHAR